MRRSLFFVSFLILLVLWALAWWVVGVVGLKLPNAGGVFDNLIAVWAEIVECSLAFDNFASARGEIIKCSRCIRQFDPNPGQQANPIFFIPHQLPSPDSSITLFGRAQIMWYIGTNKLSPMAITILPFGDGGRT